MWNDMLLRVSIQTQTYVQNLYLSLTYVTNLGIYFYKENLDIPPLFFFKKIEISFKQCVIFWKKQASVRSVNYCLEI